MWIYDKTVRPPAPIVDITIRHPEDFAQAVYIRAKIDTAADVSAIPITVAAQLNLPIAKKLKVKGYDDIPTSVFTYSTHFEVAQANIDSLKVIAIPGEYALLGRDVLNHFYIHLNGPELTFNLSLTPL
jgi:hypothetical protein